MTAKQNLSLRVKPRGWTNTRKYDLIERVMEPSMEKAQFIRQDQNFCAAMRAAIVAGKEQTIRNTVDEMRKHRREM